ncbi:iron-containing alcohol dehydrogenase [Crenobacter intestini]|uniref:Iron-containing alcohol dehydrogenase n=1 Tax=Crenobacter intestini TaxID=2563443 RepID=A0A4T0V5K6_9NEIS|nr:iron-containing alcohol dehydrogenase [Crenobacter intestini]TIC87040.1 iron-containing alcohol dehydrogenase [Crenobacter intestini]
MQAFDYYNPTRIVFGAGRLPEVAHLIPSGSRVLLASGGGSAERNGTLPAIRRALAGFHVTEFSGIEANPDADTLLRAASLCREQSLNFILAVGGGSVADGCKFIAAAACHDGDAWQLVSAQEPLARALPLGVVLTLPATGSESNDGAVISRRASGDKLDFSSPLLFPRFALLDPATTLSLPARQTANGVVDTFVHVLEQYLTYPAGAPVQDRFAEGLLLTLIETGPALLAKPDDLALRGTMMWCATLGLNRLIGVGVPHDWAAHMIGHAVTARLGIDHGRTLGALYPAVLAVQRGGKHDKLLQYGERVWGITGGSADERVGAAIAATGRFFAELGAPAHLADDGMQAADIAPVIAKLAEHGLTRLGERGDLDEARIRRVLEIAL